MGDTIDERDVVIRNDDDGRLDEYFMVSPRGLHVERMDHDAWVITADLDGERRFYGSFFVRWRWRRLDYHGWRRWIWFPWPHVEGIAEVEK